MIVFYWNILLEILFLQKLPRLEAEYTSLTASAKRSFSYKLLKATLPPKVEYGEQVFPFLFQYE